MRKEFHEIEKVPAEIDHDISWHLSRKRFIQSLILGSIAVQLPFLNACVGKHEDEPNFDGNNVLTNKEVEIVYRLQNFLFPNDGNGPSAANVNAHQYFVWMLSDENSPKSEFDFWWNGLQKVQDEAKELLSKDVLKFTDKELDDFVQQKIKSGWSRKWFSRMLTIIFEAVMLDPIYDVNPNQIGWKWLDHTPGMPRPSEALKYPEFLQIGK